MAFQMEGRIRYSELDCERKLSLASLIDYFQNCSTLHSESIGDGIEELWKKKRGWVLSSWQIVIDRRPWLDEEVQVETWAYGFQGFYGKRNFRMKDAKGNAVAWANSIWVYVDLETGHPTKISEEEAPYEIEKKLEMDYAPRKVKLLPRMQEQDTILVKRSLLDTNYHVNNGQYIRMAADYLPETFHVRQIRAEYKQAAKLGSQILPTVGMENQKVVVALNDEEKQPFAVIEFMQ